MEIRLENVTKRFSGQSILEDFSFSLPKQGVTVFFGPSGCGKTTLLRLLAGLEQADAGTCHCPDHPAVCFQEPRLLAWLNALENIALVRQESGSRQQAAQWLARVGLQEDAKKYPHQLSGGMRQRVSFARALYYGGDMLFLDEPFQGVDVLRKEDLFELVREAAAQKPVLMVTQDPREAVALADQIVLVSGPPVHIRKTISLPAGKRDSAVLFEYEQMLV